MVVRIALVVVAVLMSAVVGLEGVVGAGPTRYPDLRTRRPADLQFATLDDGTHVLRFSNTVWNAGPGRLELEGDPRPRQGVVKAIYQNLYDPQGKQVSHKPVNSDVTYHPTHAHFHFADFANYRLLRKDKRGGYRSTAKQGAGVKTGFCIMDTRPVASPTQARYLACNEGEQGLSVGWGDVYDSTLADQWVELRGRGLKDGEYALQSAADPNDKLNEGGGEREENNVATAYFTVRGDQITSVRGRP